MQATLKREKIVPLEKSTYMEVVGNNRITYRVTTSRIDASRRRIYPHMELRLRPA